MQELDQELRIYSANVSELTFGQIKGLRNFKDEEPLDSIAAFYDEEENRLILNSNTAEFNYVFCKAGLSQSAATLQRSLTAFRAGRRELIRLLIQIRIDREKKEQKQDQPVPESTLVNPDSKFVNVGGDIFQISKIISVKKIDTGDKSMIEIFITNRRASVRKEFFSKRERDLEFSRVCKVLELAA